MIKAPTLMVLEAKFFMDDSSLSLHDFSPDATLVERPLKYDRYRAFRNVECDMDMMCGINEARLPTHIFFMRCSRAAPLRLERAARYCWSRQYRTSVASAAPAMMSPSGAKRVTWSDAEGS